MSYSLGHITYTLLLILLTQILVSSVEYAALRSPKCFLWWMLILSYQKTHRYRKGRSCSENHTLGSSQVQKKQNKSRSQAFEGKMCETFASVKNTPTAFFVCQSSCKIICLHGLFSPTLDTKYTLWMAAKMVRQLLLGRLKRTSEHYQLDFVTQ